MLRYSPFPGLCAEEDDLDVSVVSCLCSNFAIQFYVPDDIVRALLGKLRLEAREMVLGDMCSEPHNERILLFVPRVGNLTTTSYDIFCVLLDLSFGCIVLESNDVFLMRGHWRHGYRS